MVVEPCCICFVFLIVLCHLRPAFLPKTAAKNVLFHMSQEVSKRVGSVGYHPFTVLSIY